MNHSASVLFVLKLKSSLTIQFIHFVFTLSLFFTFVKKGSKLIGVFLAFIYWNRLSCTWRKDKNRKHRQITFYSFFVDYIWDHIKTVQIFPVMHLKSQEWMNDTSVINHEIWISFSPNPSIHLSNCDHTNDQWGENYQTNA